MPSATDKAMNARDSEAENRLLSAKKACFFSDMALFGSSETAITGLGDGSLVKLNFSKFSKVLPGATDFGQPENLPFWWEGYKPNPKASERE